MLVPAAAGAPPSPGAPKVRRVLGVDPGITCTGWGIIDLLGREPRMVACGGLRPPSRLDFFARLKFIRDGLFEVIGAHAPREMAVEEIYLHKDPRAALILGHARGVAILAGLEAGLAPFQYTALQVKKAVVGYGRADKTQVQQMIKVLLGLAAIPKPEDAADALAVALTHCFWNRL